MGKNKNKNKGTRFEYRTAKEFKGRRIPASGSAKEFKGDVDTNKYIIECKKTSAKSISIQREWVEKDFKRNRKQTKKIPLLVFGYDRSDLFVILNKKDFDKLTEFNDFLCESKKPEGEFCNELFWGGKTNEV